MGRAYEAIVVGSGFGGGIAACRLAEAGMSVCVLERGRRFDGSDFPGAPGELPFALWHPTLNPRGLFDVRLMRDLTVVTAAGVGGGSLIYANVQLEAPESLFEKGWPGAIKLAQLRPFYAMTEAALMPEEVPTRLPKIRAFEAAAGRAGHQAELLPLAIYFGETEEQRAGQQNVKREHPFSGAPQHNCTNLGRCIFGCPRRAKNTIDLTYLARAERHGAEVRPLHDVRTLDPPPDWGSEWVVGFHDLEHRRDGAVQAPVLVLAAGALGTPRLLLTNRDRLDRLSPALGTRFSANGDALGGAVRPKAAAVMGAEVDFGPTMTSVIKDWPQHNFIVADGGLPPSFGWVMEVIADLNAITGWRRLLVRIEDKLARVGLSDRSLARHHVRLPPGKDVEDSLVLQMMGRDAANGHLRLTWPFRRFDIRWNIEESRPLLNAMENATVQIAKAAKAEKLFSLKRGPLGRLITVHPLGGAPMADDPAQGVVDDTGKVYGYEGLYIWDGSIVPTALGVNPSKTIAALAERGVRAFLAARGAGVPGAPPPGPLAGPPPVPPAGASSAPPPAGPPEAASGG